MTIERRENWSKGADNRSDKAALPATKEEGSALREGVNVDIAKGGALEGRIGFELVYAFEDPSSLLSLGENLILIGKVFGAYYILLLNKSLALSDLASYPLKVTMSGAEHNKELFMSVSDGSMWRFDGLEMRQWGVNTAEALPSAAVDSNGALMAGRYQYAVTFINSHGEEGGALIGAVDTDGNITFDNFQEPPAGHNIRFYVSECNGSTLYLQEEFIWLPNKVVYCPVVRSDDLVLETQFKRPPPAGHIVASYNGLVLIASGKTLWKCDPFRPHQFDRVTGFFQFPERITNAYGVDAGIYITADKTYFLSQPETTEPSLKVIAEFGAIEGSMTRATAQTIAWMTEYGPAIGDLEGQVGFPQRNSYSPSVFTKAASGVIRHNGNEIVVIVPQDDVTAGGIKSVGADDSFVQTPIQSIPAAQSLGAAFTFIDEVIPA